MEYDKIFYVEAPRKFLPKQILVLNRCKTHEAVLYSGAFRAGKTLLLAHAGIRASLENGGVEGLIGSQTHTTLKSVVMDLFEKELDLYQNQLNKANILLNLYNKILYSEGKMEITFYNKSRVRFRACDKERKLAGYTLDWFGIDEPVDVDEEIFTQLLGRISGTGNLKNKFGILTTNPASELHWLYKYFYIMKLDNYIHIDTNTYDNRLLPNYDKYIKSKEQAFDKDWVNRYLNGQWGFFEGQIYKEFDPTSMTGDYDKIPIDYHIASVDWGLENPHCVLDIGITSDNRLIILKEDYGSNVTTHELSKRIADWHKDLKFKKVYCDPSAADLIQQTYDKGVPIAYMASSTLRGYADNDVKNGIARVKSLFKQRKILIDKKCINTIKELQSYRYKEGKDEPIKKDDHACDALRYGTTDFSDNFNILGFKGTLSNLFKRRY